MPDSELSQLVDDESRDVVVDDRVTVISCDGHVGPGVRAELRAYCPEKHLADFDDYLGELEQSQLRTTVNNELDPPQERIDVLVQRARFEGLHDPVARLRDMDADGISAEVIFHGGANGQTVPFSMFGVTVTWSSRKFDHLEDVGVEIYNRWLADYVSADPKRLLGLAHVTAHDVDKAISEVKWAKEAGLRGVNLPAPRRDFTPYSDPSWDPFWAVCEDLEMTLCTHAGLGDLDDRFRGPSQNPIYLVEMAWFGRRAIWHLIFSGVFARFPNLKYMVAEQFGDWVPATLSELDSTYLTPHFSAKMREVVPERPSDYFRRCCYVGASFMSREEAEMGVENDLVGNIMWGADYPHPEGSFPHSTLALRKTLAGLPASAVRAYVTQTAADAFHIDVAALEPIAQRIGPPFSELMKPYPGRPEGSATSFAFRDFGHWV